MSDRPLPDGWVRQHDPGYDHPYWVDTRSEPPRAIWVHPYEDDQFLDEHPDARDNKQSLPDLEPPPSYDTATETHAQGSGDKPASSKHPGPPDPMRGEGSHAEHKRGVFARLIDKTIGTREEREALKRSRAEQAARAEERAHRERMRRQEEREALKRSREEQAARAEERAHRERMRQREEHEALKRSRAEQAARAEERAHRERMRQQEEREAYMRAHGGYAPYHPSYGSGRGLGGDNTAALLLGGLAGGLLLGDIFGGGF